jgi:putative ABC transport system permease protein
MSSAATRAAVQVAAQTLRAHPLRSMLSTLGVVMGVASLVAVLAIGDGIERFVREQVGRHTDVQTLVVDARTEDVVDGMRIPRQDVARFSLSTVDSLALSLGTDAGVSVTVAGTGLLPPGPGGKPRPALVQATTPLFAKWGEPIYLAGRFYSDEETHAGAAVVVVTDGLAELALPGLTPAQALDHTVELSGASFRVIGVLKSKGEAKEKKVMAFVPITIADRAMVPAPAPRSPSLLVRSATIEAVDTVRGRLQAWLTPRFGVAGGSYQIQAGPAERLRQAKQGILLFKVMMGAFSGITLLVGGIGIMNVLLAAVLERTREIGIRKAMGARRRDILFQFLSESVVISGAGASFGIALGLGTAFLASAMMRAFAEAPVHAAFSWPSVLLAASIAVGIGLAFGLYPALRAARLSPVDAMRTE